MQIIGDVLDACRDNIDSAIKQLGQMRLTAHCGTAQPATSGADQAANPNASAGSQAAGQHQSKGYTQEECNPCCHLWLTANQRSWQRSPPFP